MSLVVIDFPLPLSLRTNTFAHTYIHTSLPRYISIPLHGFNPDEGWTGERVLAVAGMQDGRTLRYVRLEAYSV